MWCSWCLLFHVTQKLFCLASSYCLVLRKTFHFWKHKLKWERTICNKLTELIVCLHISGQIQSSNSITSVRSSRAHQGHEHTSSSCVTSVGAAAEKAAHHDEAEVTWWLQKWQESQYKLRIKVTLIEDLLHLTLVIWLNPHN